MQNVKFLKITLTVIFINITFSVPLSQNLYEFTGTKYLLGTKIDITAIYTSIDSMKKAEYYAFKEIERIQGIMSNTIDTSEIFSINKYSGIKKVKVSYETYYIIERSVEYSKKYKYFDITIGPITELWGFNSDSPVNKVPDKRIIDSLLQFVGSEKIILDPTDTSVFLKLQGMKLDLGGIAKGYAVDRAVIIMKKNGMKNFFINAGGDIYVCGIKQGNEKWSIGIKNPRMENEIIASLDLPSDGAIATSGDYERFVIIDGKRYHHIMDVKTGYPVMSSQSATSFAPTTEEAVILSKYLFVTGANNFNKPDYTPGIIIDSEGNISYNNSLLTEYNLKIIK